MWLLCDCYDVNVISVLKIFKCGLERHLGYVEATDYYTVKESTHQQLVMSFCCQWYQEVSTVNQKNP